jgi:putative transposase
MVKRTYKYRFYPTPDQAMELSRTFGCVRVVWNRMLEERTAAWYERHERISYVKSSALLTEWKRSEELAYLSQVSAVPLQQTLRHLQAAFVAFWDKRAQYPRFKSRKRSRQAAEYTRSAFRWKAGQLTLAKMKAPLNIRWSRPIPEDEWPSTVTVSRDAAGRWFVCLLCECPIEPVPHSVAAIGVDAGVTSLVTLSSGEKITNPAHERDDRGLSVRSATCRAKLEGQRTGLKHAGR